MRYARPPVLPLRPPPQAGPAWWQVRTMSSPVCEFSCVRISLCANFHVCEFHHVCTDRHLPPVPLTWPFFSSPCSALLALLLAILLSPHRPLPLQPGAHLRHYGLYYSPMHSTCIPSMHDFRSSRLPLIVLAGMVRHRAPPSLPRQGITVLPALLAAFRENTHRSDDNGDAVKIQGITCEPADVDRAEFCSRFDSGPRRPGSR